jgi:hypothetical protein
MTIMQEDDTGQTETPVLSYARPDQQNGKSPRNLLLAGGIQCVVLLLLASLVLDGGNALKAAFADVGCYMLMCAWILRKRGRRLTTVDRIFLAAGPVLMMIPVIPFVI